MGKPGKRHRDDPRQLSLTFDAPPAVTPTEGELAGVDRLIAGYVSRILQEDGRSKGEIAASVSAILADTVSAQMLDAYAAPAKGSHNISLARFLGLVLSTRRADVLDALAIRIGCRVLEGEDYVLAQLGHVRAERQRLEKVERELSRKARPFEGRTA